MIRRLSLFLLITMAFGTWGCLSARSHAKSVQAANQDDRLTVGVVQSEIRRGMSGSEVAEALGSPNIVTTDEQGREVWVYDKIATDRVYSQGEGYASILIVGGAGKAGADSTSQRTLTVVIKFDEKNQVRDFAYHSSRF